jgi:hypothetical protein
MGNLYTHVVRQPDKRISLLSLLRQEWQNFPHNFKLIKKLSAELKALQKENTKEKFLLTDSFGNQYQVNKDFYHRTIKFNNKQVACPSA